MPWLVHIRKPSDPPDHRVARPTDRDFVSRAYAREHARRVTDGTRNTYILCRWTDNGWEPQKED